VKEEADGGVVHVEIDKYDEYQEANEMEDGKPSVDLESRVYDVVCERLKL
jgi:hypothetical protein